MREAGREDEENYAAEAEPVQADHECAPRKEEVEFEKLDGERVYNIGDGLKARRNRITNQFVIPDYHPITKNRIYGTMIVVARVFPEKDLEDCIGKPVYKAIDTPLTRRWYGEKDIVSKCANIDGKCVLHVLVDQGTRWRFINNRPKS